MMHLRTASVTLFAILSAIISTACDRNTTTALEPVEPSAAPTIGPLAARAIALAMAQTPIRAQVLIDLRDSPYSEHKVVLQDYLRTSGGQRLLGAMDRAGIDTASLHRTLQDTPRIQFYVPVAAQRASWRGTPDVLVVPNLTRETSDIAFTPTGATQQLDLAKGPPSDTAALFVLQWAEPMFHRWAGRTAATETIQDAGEPQIGGGTVERDASGRILRIIDDTRDVAHGLHVMNQEGMSVPAGTYLTSLANLNVCDNVNCDGLEIEFRSTVYGTADRYVSAQLTGIGKGESWNGLWKVHDARAILDTSIVVEVWELDSTSPDDPFYCMWADSDCNRAVTDWVYLDGSVWGPIELCENSSDSCGPFPVNKPTDLAVTFADRAPPLVTTVTVSPASFTVACGGTAQLTAMAEDQYGDVMTDKMATWSSSNTNIATVASTGSLTADGGGVDAGEATITATIDGVPGTASTSVVLPCIARPNSDIENPGSWSPTPSNWPLWMTLSEAGMPNDNSAVPASFSGGQTKSFTVGLSDVRAPQSTSGLTIRARARYRTSGAVGTFNVELMEGAVVKATRSTDLTTQFQTLTYTLTAGEAASVTNYADLRLRVTHTLYGGGPVTVDCSWLEFQVP